MKTKSVKINFDDWKTRSKDFDLGSSFVSMNGRTEKITVKAIKTKNVVKNK